MKYICPLKIQRADFLYINAVEREKSERAKKRREERTVKTRKEW